MPPSASIAARVIDPGRAPRETTRYGSNAVGGIGVAVIVAVGKTVGAMVGDATVEATARVAVAVGGRDVDVGTIVDVGGTGVVVGFGAHEARVLPLASARAYKTDWRINSRRDSILWTPQDWVAKFKILNS